MESDWRTSETRRFVKWVIVTDHSENDVTLSSSENLSDAGLVSNNGVAASVRDRENILSF